MSEQSLPKKIETQFERILFSARWLLAPFYFGLAVSIGILLIKFLAELWHIGSMAFSLDETQIILGVLTLVDLALTASLLIIVIFSGYENFVSKIDTATTWTGLSGWAPSILPA
jgi:uncharacterized protein (TIGR00645 family)